MSETPRTDEAELYYRDVCEGKDSPLYLVASDFARDLERDLRAAQARLAALLEPGEYGALLQSLRKTYSTGPGAEAATAIEQLQAQKREQEEHERQTHETLGAILGTDDSLEQCVKRMQVRAEQAEARLAEEIATRAGEMVLLREKLTECQNDANEIVRGFEQGVFIKDTKNYSLHLARDAFPALAALGRATRRKEQT